MTTPRVLIIDNNIDTPWRLCPDFRRYLEGMVAVRRAPQEDLPPDPTKFTHVILTGSKTSILDSSPWVLKLMDYVRRAADRKVPTLGVCYGHQLIARAYGGDQFVRRSPTPEFGWVEVRQTRDNPILDGLPKSFYSFQFHFEDVTAPPPGFVATAESPRCAVQAYYVEGKPLFGVQFHPERNLEEGQQSIAMRRKMIPEGCLFGDGEGKSVFSENVARIIFKNFLALGGA
jgi:GMP synthase (glutamine-hydrolysing)